MIGTKRLALQKSTDDLDKRWKRRHPEGGDPYQCEHDLADAAVKVTSAKTIARKGRARDNVL